MKLLDIILILFLLCCCILNKKEGFSIAGQLIIPPLQYRIIQPTTSYYETSICEDDNNWTNGDLKCGDYFIEDYDCEDLGDDGRQAFEACKRTCDNCKPDVKLKETDNKMLERFPDKRIPSPVSDLDNFEFADYGEFDGMMGSGSDVGMNAELYSKIDDLTGIVEELKGSYDNMDFMGGGGSGSGGFTSCPGATCDTMSEFSPTECNSKIKGPNFTFDSEGEGEGDKYYALQCGGENSKVNVSKVIGVDTLENIYYDCESGSWVYGADYKPHIFYADYTCLGTSPSADCVQEWGRCLSDEDVCKRTYGIKSNQVGAGIVCRDDVGEDLTHCTGSGETCRNIDVSLGGTTPPPPPPPPPSGGVDCVETGNTAVDCTAACGILPATVTTPASGGGAACTGDYTCRVGDGDCLSNPVGPAVVEPVVDPAVPNTGFCVDSATDLLEGSSNSYTNLAACSSPYNRIDLSWCGAGTGVRINGLGSPSGVSLTDLPQLTCSVPTEKVHVDVSTGFSNRQRRRDCNMSCR
jgi:hypothetical protein